MNQVIWMNFENIGFKTQEIFSYKYVCTSKVIPIDTTINQD